MSITMATKSIQDEQPIGNNGHEEGSAVQRKTMGRLARFMDRRTKERLIR